MNKVVKKIFGVGILLLFFTIPGGFIFAESAPTCSISFTPKVVELGKDYTASYKTTGKITSVIVNGTGDFNFLKNFTWNSDSPFVVGLNSGYFSNEILARVVGEASETLTVIGPNGSSTCTASLTVAPKPNLVSSSKKIVATQTEEEKKKQDSEAHIKMGNDVLAEFIKEHPEYAPENDPNDIKWNIFKEKIASYDLSNKTAEQLKELFESIHKNIIEESKSKESKKIIIILFSVLILFIFLQFLKSKDIIKIDFSKIKILSFKRKWVILISVILVGVVIVGGIVFGIKKYQSDIKTREQQTADLITKQKETSEALIASQQRALDDVKSKLNELENRKPQVIYKTIQDTTPKELTVAQIAKEWSPQVVYVYCEWIYSNGTFDTAASGSGFITKFSGGIFQVVTNKHVLLDEGKYRPNFCSTHFLNGEKYTTNWGDGTNFTQNANFDAGAINISGLSDNVKQMVENHGASYCPNEPEIGDKVVVLGYPGIGSSSGITVTEGIISGYEGAYYVTSAKIDHGNSGGIAVSVKNNCIVGMPSASIGGSLESLGRILSTKAMFTK